MTSLDSSAAAATPSRHERRTGRVLVGVQLGLAAALLALPHRTDWPVPPVLDRLSRVGAALGLLVMGLGGGTLGRGLTAAPAPNERARLRTGGMYRLVRHPIYAGLLLAAGALTVRSGSVHRLAVWAALTGLLTGKARFEETLLTRRFPGYPAYAEVTPRFLPGARVLSSVVR